MAELQNQHSYQIETIALGRNGRLTGLRSKQEVNIWPHIWKAQTLGRFWRAPRNKRKIVTVAVGGGSDLCATL